MRLHNIVTIIAALGSAVLAGCGGGGGGGGGGATVATTVVSGVASKGPINGGTIEVFAISAAGVKGNAPLNTAVIKTGADGRYSVDLGSYTGGILVEVRGGTYQDEADPTATKELQTEASAGMRAMVANVGAGTNTVAVTPFTELAARKVESKGGAFTADNINQANAGISGFFKLPDIVSTTPADASSASSQSATPGQKEYALALATVSQHLKEKGGTLGNLLDATSSEMATTGGLSAATLADLNSATQNFLTSANNKTGLTSAGVQPIRPTAGVLKLKTAGQLAAGSTIGGIDITVTIPGGLTLKTDSFGVPLSGVVTLSGASAEGSQATNTTVSLAKFTAATGTSPATLRVIMANPSGFGVGEFLTVNCDVASGVSFPDLSGFTLGTPLIVDAHEVALPAITASGASFTVLIQ